MPAWLSREEVENVFLRIAIIEGYGCPARVLNWHDLFILFCDDASRIELRDTCWQQSRERNENQSPKQQLLLK